MHGNRRQGSTHRRGAAIAATFGGETSQIAWIGLLLLLLLLNLLLGFERARTRLLGRGLQARLSAVEDVAPAGAHGLSRSPGGRGLAPRPLVFISCDRAHEDPPPRSPRGRI